MNPRPGTEYRNTRRATIAGGVSILLATAASPALAQNDPNTTPRPQACAGDNGGITLPDGFCAGVFADNLGHPRHMAIAPNGVLYVNTWSGRYYGNDTPPPGGFLIALQDRTGTGKADVVTRFGPDFASGNHGGTGIALYNGALYAETNDSIVRYALPAGTIVPTGTPDVVVSGLPLTGDHPMHPFIIDPKGAMYVDLGSATNACQTENRIANAPGHQPCTELETRAGTWVYDANGTDQRFSPTERFVTGLRNGEGFAFDDAGRFYATQHGRDQLRENWASLYQPQTGANEPAEELVLLKRGADYGWPECYFDNDQQKLVLAPEYGGDGKKIGVCADKKAPVARATLGPSELSGQRPGIRSLAEEHADPHRRIAVRHLPHPRHSLRERDPPDHHHLDPAVGRPRRAVAADGGSPRSERDRDRRPHIAHRHRQEERHHARRFCSAG
jgi:glucose/arabinose dehydrogenase